MFIKTMKANMIVSLLDSFSVEAKVDSRIYCPMRCANYSQQDTDNFFYAKEHIIQSTITGNINLSLSFVQISTAYNVIK